ncbi:(2Fe-2S)-binding protein [Acinetobacter sp.]|uniref:(2Fe-2S)-binding protein n=1 Tax=Acinetobacter sp. TaxID=472 RepID=UPI003890BE44
MIICICSNVTEKEIKQLFPLSLEDIMMTTAAGMCCGGCLESLQEIIECPGTLIENREKT